MKKFDLYRTKYGWGCYINLSDETYTSAGGSSAIEAFVGTAFLLLFGSRMYRFYFQGTYFMLDWPSVFLRSAWDKRLRPMGGLQI